MSTIAEARRRVTTAAALAVVWCAAIWFVALALTDDPGPRVTLAIPVVISLGAWALVPTRAGRPAALLAAALMMLFAFAAILTVGILYVPPAVALCFASAGFRRPAPTRG